MNQKSISPGLVELAAGRHKTYSRWDNQPIHIKYGTLTKQIQNCLGVFRYLKVH